MAVVPHNPMDPFTQKGTQERPDYRSYLLRLYRVSDGGKLVWRMSLESSLTGEREGFASLNGLLGFLQQQMGMTSNTERDER
jgi:hypothetical protein